MADQLFKKRQGKRKERKSENREMKPYRYLIVCEGEKTEPNYFEGFKEEINSKYKDQVKIKKWEIDIEGTGRNTESLVEYASELQRKSAVEFGNIWCVFDKDDFTDEQFNNAIEKCKKNDFKPAWSNKAIELWFLLHFEYLNTAVERVSYIKKLNEYFKNFSVNNGKYEKNLKDIYKILKEYGNCKKAIVNAKKLNKTHPGNFTPSKMNPATKVYELVEELLDIINNIKNNLWMK